MINTMQDIEKVKWEQVTEQMLSVEWERRASPPKWRLGWNVKDKKEPAMKSLGERVFLAKFTANT